MWSIDYHYTPHSAASNPLPSPLPRINSFGYMDYLPAWTFYWHFHDMGTELTFAVKGSGYLHVGTHTIPIRAGCICMIPRMMLHYYSSDAADPLEYYIVAVDVVEQSVPMTKWLTADVARVFHAEPYADHVLFILDMISDQVSKKHRIAGADLQTAIYTLLFWLRNSASRIREDVIEADAFPLQEALLYIAQHYPEKITLEDLCKLQSASPASLNRLFNQYCGMSPVKYLLYFRITQSLRFLQYTNLPISEVADLVGFHNQTHFSRLFAKYIGCTPAVFRSDLRQKFSDFLDAGKDAEAFLSSSSLRAVNGYLSGPDFRLH